MIFDAIRNAHYYYGLGTRFEKAFRFLEHVDYDSLEQGKHPIDGEDVFAIVRTATTIPEAEETWEAHRRYTDVQYVAEGGEWMGYAPLHVMRAMGKYSEEKDCQLFEGVGNFIRVSTGMFAVFSPTDVHKPGVHLGEAEQVKKIVVKVRV